MFLCVSPCQMLIFCLIVFALHVNAFRPGRECQGVLAPNQSEKKIKLTSNMALILDNYICGKRTRWTDEMREKEQRG